MLLTVLIGLSSLYGQVQEGVLYKGDSEYLTLDDGKIELYWFDYNTRREMEYICDYELLNDQGISFIRIGEPISEKWLFLNSQYFLVVYKNDSKEYFSAGFGSILSLDNTRLGTCSATSYLIEKNKEYSPENLRKTTPNNPWVEGVDGPGIGEKIFVELQTWKDSDGSPGGMGAMIISNGYVSYSNPSLYNKNNRVKEIRVSSKDPDFSFTATLSDTPNPQIVKFPTPPKSITIEILSVHPGTHWDDTCINFIYFLEKIQAKQIE